MCDARRLPRRRTAFTLIELLVVITLILVVGAIGVGYAVYGQDNNHSSNAAATVIGAMLNGRGRAHFSGLPTGIRLVFGTNGLPATQCGQIVLVQQPEDYNLGQISSATTGPPWQISFTQVDFMGGADYAGQSTLTSESTVEAGDYFTMPGQPPHRINSVLQTSTPPNGTIQLDSPLATNLLAGTGYAIVRGPRRVPSEDIITLPANMVIENMAFGPYTTGLCQNLPMRTLVDSKTGAPTQVAEIIFSSAGPLTGQGASYDEVLLWLRDPSPNTPPLTPRVGAPQIISIQVRTGIIGVYTVGPWNGGAVGPGNDPFVYARDPRASGS